MEMYIRLFFFKSQNGKGGKTLKRGYLHTPFRLGMDKTNISSQDQQGSNQQKPVKTHQNMKHILASQIG